MTDNGSDQATWLRRFSAWLLALIVLASSMFIDPILISSSFAQAVFPQQGFPFDCDPKRNYGEWRCNGGGVYQKTTNKNGVLHFEDICCLYTLSPFGKRARKMMLVRTTDKTNEVRKIVEWMLVEWRPDDYFDDTQSCEMNGMKFEISVVNERRRSIVGIIIDENGFKQFSYNWISFPCSIP